MAGFQSGTTAKDLAYVRRRYITADGLRQAISIVSNGTLHARDPKIWGDGKSRKPSWPAFTCERIDRPDIWTQTIWSKHCKTPCEKGAVQASTCCRAASTKVRYFGLWHPAHRQDAARVRQMLQLQAPPPTGPLPETAVPPDPTEAAVAPPIEPRICPHCHQGRLIFIRTFARGQAMGP